ncbi:hypothetical protein [Rhodococcus sp. 008]|nr:hypothetical protein [Rhodococcus sp. 008]
MITVQAGEAVSRREFCRTVGSEFDDLAVEDGFAVVEHGAECVDDLG